MNHRLLIVDGHAYAYRAFFAIRSLRSPTGQPTNAIYGFVKMLEKMRAALKPTHSIVVWDGGLSAERMAALPGYKAQRPEMPDDLRPQFDGIGEYLSAAGIASYCGDGVEADDYIACLARRAESAGWDVVIASSDKDFLQLVNERIGILNPNDKSEKIWTPADVEAKTGVTPAQVADWLALIGDAVDNIPGVRGVGPNTAAELLKKCGSVEALYARLAEIRSESQRAALAAAADAVKRNQLMVRLHEQKEGGPVLAALVPREPQKAALRAMYAKWGFRSLLAELGEPLEAVQASLF